MQRNTKDSTTRVMGATITGAGSGADDAVLAELRSRNLLAGILDAQLPSVWKALYLLATFRPQKQHWYEAWQNKMLKNPHAFHARTRALDRQLRRRQAEFDVVLQFGAFFAAFDGAFPKPVTLACDYTTKLAELNYEPWFRLSKAEAEAWYELETRLYQACAIIFTVSDNTRRSLIQHYGVEPSRVHVAREGVYAVHEHPEKTYDTPTVIMVGVDFERKGGPTLLKAFANVKRQVPQARLLVIGPRPRPSAEGIIWLGYVGDRKRLNQLFADSAVFCMPTICEPFGLAVIEAMSHGLPVVVSKVDAMPEIVQEGQTGFLVSPGDPDALAERLISLLSSPELCARMGRAGRARVAQDFLWTHVADEYVKGIKEVHQGS